MSSLALRVPDVADAQSALRPSLVASAESSAVFVRARARLCTDHPGYAGGVLPAEAWELFSSGAAVIVDVRTAEERKFVGHVPGTLHVAWATGTSMTRNPRFVREVEAKVSKTQPLLLLCRSGKRSVAAAEALTKAGFTEVYNVLEGFEGDHNAQQQRGGIGGWRHWNLPWVQD